MSMRPFGKSKAKECYLYEYEGKPKAKPRELMFKVNNIIPLWRVVFSRVHLTLIRWKSILFKSY